MFLTGTNFDGVSTARASNLLLSFAISDPQWSKIFWFLADVLLHLLLAIISAFMLTIHELMPVSPADPVKFRLFP
jgi:hypothetical protein